MTLINVRLCARHGPLPARQVSTSPAYILYGPRGETCCDHADVIERCLYIIAIMCGGVLNSIETYSRRVGIAVLLRSSKGWIYCALLPSVIIAGFVWWLYWIRWSGRLFDDWILFFGSKCICNVKYECIL